MRGILIGLALALVSGPVWPQTRQQLHWCSSPKATEDQRIKGCTALIQSGRATTVNQAAAYAVLAHAYASKGLYDQAIADGTQSLASNPNSAYAYHFRGFAYSHKGLYDQAIADQTRAIALQPDYAFAYNSRAWALHKNGEGGLGLPDAEKAVSLSLHRSLAPSALHSDRGLGRPNADFFATRAEIYEKLGRRGEAIADYLAARKLDPNNQSARDGLTRLGVIP